jgi:hypothetical protein
MVVGASITVNNSRSSGDLQTGLVAEDTILLKQILLELKKQNKETMVANRQKSSGFGAATGSGGIIGALTKGPTAIMMALAAAFASGSGRPGPGGESGVTFTGGIPGTGYNGEPAAYSKITGEDGSTKYAEINRKTGEILDILTEEEAQQRDIIDSLGNVNNWLIDQEAESKSILGGMEKSNGSYQVSNSNLALIETHINSYEKVSKETLKWAKDARDAQKIIAEKLARKAGLNLSDLPGDASSPFPKSGPRTTVDVIFGGQNPISNPGDQTYSNVINNYDLDNQYISPADPTLKGGLQ